MDNNIDRRFANSNVPDRERGNPTFGSTADNSSVRDRPVIEKDTMDGKVPKDENPNHDKKRTV